MNLVQKPRDCTSMCMFLFLITCIYVHVGDGIWIYVHLRMKHRHVKMGCVSVSDTAACASVECPAKKNYFFNSDTVMTWLRHGWHKNNLKEENPSHCIIRSVTQFSLLNQPLLVLSLSLSLCVVLLAIVRSAIHLPNRSSFCFLKKSPPTGQWLSSTLSSLGLLPASVLLIFLSLFILCHFCF